jgi:hypothetical protein
VSDASNKSVISISINSIEVLDSSKLLIVSRPINSIHSHTASVLNSPVTLNQSQSSKISSEVYPCIANSPKEIFSSDIVGTSDSSHSIVSLSSKVTNSSKISKPSVSVYASKVLDSSKSPKVSYAVNVGKTDSSVVLNSSKILNTP